MFVEERFKLDNNFITALREKHVPWGFGYFSEVIYFRTYSRLMSNGMQEQWADTVARVVEGVMSIRKDHYRKCGLKWIDEQWQALAQELATAIFEMKMLPPGRGLWAMGTDYVYERGSASLFNCAYTDVTNDLADSAAWAMDMLMLGVGVGASTQNATFDCPRVFHDDAYHQTYIIPDTREGWVESVRILLNSYLRGGPYWHFDYSQIRPEGTPLKGFGGLASGPAPLMELHNRLRSYINQQAVHFDRTRLVADVMNAIGACVVSGNIRRSAELLLGGLHDSTFVSLKNYDAYPLRKEIGWMSNNSVVLSESDQFEYLPQIAENVIDNGEPGIINLINVQKYGRVGKHKVDRATGFNPCAEIPLEDRELCNLVETFPTRCSSLGEFWRTLELATFYSSTVSLLPTHEPATNSVIMRNRRIGVSVSGVADWLDSTNLSHVTMALRKGYEEHVQPVNERLARDAGVPASVRLTTIKPSGTISLLAGVSPGMHFPVSRYALRRVRVSEVSPIVQALESAGYHGVQDNDSSKTLVYAFPLRAGNGKTRDVSEVSIWEQASLVAMLQREWADNAVSNTLTFRESERNQVERVLAAFAPLVKSMSLLPDQDERAELGGERYENPPYEKISQQEYGTMVEQLKPIDWQRFGGSDGVDSKFCDNDVCDI